MTALPLIPRRLLFGNPSRTYVRLSRDGQWLSWLAPRDGVLNIWLAPRDNPAAAEPLTAVKGRPIASYFWAYDHRHIAYAEDASGDENWRISLIDIQTRKTRLVTPETGVNAQLWNLSRERPNTLVIGLNDRDPRWHDAWEIDVPSGERTLVFKNTEEYAMFAFDENLVPRFASKPRPEQGGSTLYRLEEGKGVPYFDIPHEDELLTGIMRFNAASTHFTLISSLGRDRAALFRVDATTDARTLLAEHPRADIQGYIADQRSGEIVAAGADYVRQDWIAVDPAIAPTLRLLQDSLDGAAFDVLSQTPDDALWLVAAHKPEQPVVYHLLDRQAGTITQLFESRPELAGTRLAPMQGHVIKSRDGLDLVSYLTLPSDEPSEKPREPLPMVLYVHGGPWGRDELGYNGGHQWLANRGYAVLSVNYRASTGFGKAFTGAGDREHAGKMHDDLIDAVAWAVTEGIAQKDKVAIMGGSYGGYATLVGLTFTPEVFRCGVSIVGISNLVTLLETIPPYWVSFRHFMNRAYHDVSTEEGRAWLWARSPLSRVDAIRKPLLLGHGANDVRCKVAESDQIVDAMKSRGLPVAYVVYPDEGHGFARPENRLSFYAITEAFLAEHLGGRAEPVGEDFAGSSHDIRAGLEGLTV